MYSCSPTLNQISLKNFIGKVFFSNFGHVTSLQNENSFFGHHFETQHFLMFFLLIYDCFRCIQIWWEFRTEILTGKYLKMVGWVQVDPPPLCTNGSEK